MDTAISLALKEIDLIREYRTRLIADIVSGQLDVREAAASLPEIEGEDTVALLAEADDFAENGDFTDENVDLDNTDDASD